MYSPRTSPSVEIARRLRRDLTPEERVLWTHLRSKQLGVTFRRQEPMGRYVADFVCYECDLIVEVDGSQHFNSEQDKTRDADMAEHGFETLRFWNNEVRENMNGVLERIQQSIKAKRP
ncbi:DUF559 domain-containing protein (plasmid) [Deinococcus psychrotolerans]|uniref:DUF559 domain-containing protein n=1 Tax=Deinococcus psychrotolerans TaxID=2489213 RepID=A0A3G8YHB2_9DEIO|nr:DUF559 domain-containing protein [Deinococcus psychrotolerans]AZI44678.1 DUF559 domain-containing protein [Deinococcus psychrotolerans]